MPATTTHSATTAPGAGPSTDILAVEFAGLTVLRIACGRPPRPSTKRHSLGALPVAWPRRFPGGCRSARGGAVIPR
jgi:hypothetical protein